VSATRKRARVRAWGRYLNRRSRFQLSWLFPIAIFFLLPPSVSAAVSIAVGPSAVNLPAAGTQQFTAIVTGASDTSVSWKVQEGASGGSITNAGLYSAPGVAGTYHIVATTKADNTQSATAIVIVPGFLRSGLLYIGPCMASLLPNGTVLYTGGMQPGGNPPPTNNAEIYDPAASASTATGNLTIARCSGTATLLPNGKVLFAGGQLRAGQTATAELYDPLSGTFAATGSMSVARIGHTATLLPNGKVLITGGGNCNSGFTESGHGIHACSHHGPGSEFYNGFGDSAEWHGHPKHDCVTDRDDGNHSVANFGSSRKQHDCGGEL
jgi:hypothetical protein